MDPSLSERGKVAVAHQRTAERRAALNGAVDSRMSDQIDLRRRSKILRFIVAEILAVALLLVGGVGLAARPANPTVVIVLDVLMLTAAGAVAAIPIFFFALAPILPRSRRDRYR